MGLDMYLSASIYTGGGYQHVRESSDPRNIRDRKRFDHAMRAAGLKFGDFEAMNSAEINVQVAYWRKANAIHHWFVTEHAGGVDDCKPINVLRSDLRDLLDTAQRVLDTAVKGDPVTESGIFGSYEAFPDATLDQELAAEVLPPSSGFFFGSTNLDQWYIADLESTVQQLKAILEHKKLADVDGFIYQASW